MYFDRSIKNVMLLNKRESKYEKFQIAMFDKKLKFLEIEKSQLTTTFVGVLYACPVPTISGTLR